MSVEIKGRENSKLRQLRDALDAYVANHERARAVLFRGQHGAIWIRVIDPSFRGKSRATRQKLLWTFIEKLPTATQQDIGILLPLTPTEAKSSELSQEFDSPQPIRKAV